MAKRMISRGFREEYLQWVSTRSIRRFDEARDRCNDVIFDEMRGVEMINELMCEDSESKGDYAEIIFGFEVKPSRWAPK
jgi:hypothetical protein